MAGRGRILFYAGRGNGKPSGGFGVILQQAGWLLEAGLPCGLLVEDGFRSAFETLPAGIPLIPAGTALSREDSVVFPETDIRVVARNRSGARAWLLCQNHHYLFNTTEHPRDWLELGLAGVIATSPAIARYARRHLADLPVVTVPAAVADEFFAADPGGTARKEGAAFMPRKRPQETRFIQGSFALRYPGLALPWSPIDQMGRAEVVATMASNRFFLFLGRHEGLGLPALEAMAAGAFVVGFRGGGVDGYASPENGLWADPDDFDTLIDHLAFAVLMARAEPSRFEAILAAGRGTARRFRSRLAKDALFRFWQGAAP